MQSLHDELPPSAIPPDFTSYDKADAWRHACARASERFGPQNKFRVAPGCEFPAHPELAPGVILRAGDEVIPHDHYLPNAIEALIRRGVVIRGTPEGELFALTPADARYVCARSVLTASGTVLIEGTEIHPFLLRNGQTDLDRLVAAGAVIDRSSTPSQASSPADRDIADALKALAAAEADLTAAQSTWIDDETSATTKALRAARENVELAQLRVAGARKKKDAAEATAKVAHRERLFRQLDEIDVEKKAAAVARAQKQGAIRTAALAFARALVDDRDAADVEYEAALRWNLRYSEIHEIGIDQVYSSLPIVPDPRKLIKAIVDATGGRVEGHELLQEFEL